MDPILAAVFGFIAGVGVFSFVLITGLFDAETGSGEPQLPGPSVGPWTFLRPEGELVVRCEHDPVTRFAERTPTHLDYSLVLLRSPAHLPQLELRPRGGLVPREGFDGRFEVRRRGRGASRLLAAPVLRRGLLAVAKRADTWDGLVSLNVGGTATGSTLELRKEGHIATEAEAAEQADALGGIARAALEAWDEPWRQAAERWSLGPIERDEQGLRRLDAELEGATLRIEERVEHGELIVELRAEIPALARFTNLRVVHRDEAQREGWDGMGKPTGNPVLDLCVAVIGVHRPGVRELLEDAALTEALLPIVHGRRGELGSQGVRLIPPDPHGVDLEEVCGELLALVQAISTRLAALAPSAP